MSQLIFRHGNRAPLNIYTNSPCPISSYPDGYGSLLNEGKWNAFLLGQRLRQRYIEDTRTRLIQAGSSYKELYSISTDVERCTQTLQAVLSGFLPPDNTIYRWNEQLNWNPFPFRTTKDGEDNILRSDRSNCQKLNKIISDKYSSKEMKLLLSQNQELMKYLSEKSGMIVNETNIRNLCNTLKIDKYDMIARQPVCNKVSEWATEELLSILERFMKKFSKITNDIHDKEFRLLLGGPLLSTLASNMKKFQRGSSPKIYLFSAHDSTLYQIIASLGLHFEERIDFVSTFAFELYQDKKSGHLYIELYFNGINSPNNRFVKYVIPHCPYPCLLTKFLESYKDVMSVNRVKECSLE